MSDTDVKSVVSTSEHDPSSAGEAVDQEVVAATAEEAIEVIPPLDKAVIKLGLSTIERSHVTKNYFFSTLKLIAQQVQTVDGLQAYPGLKHLDFAYNSLTDLSPLTAEALPDLLSAGFQHNQLSNYASFTPASSLELLQLDHNQITSVADGHSFVQLTGLGLSFNNLTSLQGFTASAYPNLAFLDVSMNQITTVSQLAECKESKLRVLNLSGNQLTSLQGLEQLQALEELNLNENQIASVEEFKKIMQQLPNLRSLTVLENAALFEEVPDENDLLKEVLLWLPNLDFWCGKVVTSSDRIESDTLHKERIAEALEAKKLLDEENEGEEEEEDEEEEDLVTDEDEDE